MTPMERYARAWLLWSGVLGIVFNGGGLCVLAYLALA
jgi:hypothetical protein